MGAGECPHCGYTPDASDLPEDLKRSVKSSLQWLSSLWKSYQGDLDAWDDRIRRALRRVEGLERSKKVRDVREREKLKVWLQEAMAQRGRLENLCSDAGGALLTFSRLWSLPDTSITRKDQDEELRERMAVLEERKENLDTRKQRMEEWWEAHRKIQRDLFSLAIGREVDEEEVTTDLTDLVYPIHDLIERLEALHGQDVEYLEDAGLLGSLRQLLETVEALLDKDVSEQDE
ncbi:MAG: hypothetical protein ACE5HJ_08545 [Thermoplasmata archaeon]